MRAKLFFDNFTSDASIRVKVGTGTQENCYNSTKNYARWGDYSGTARRYNASVPTVWVAGSVGEKGKEIRNADDIATAAEAVIVVRHAGKHHVAAVTAADDRGACGIKAFMHGDEVEKRSDVLH